MTHYQLTDVGGALSWGALLHFVSYLPRTSALSQEMRPLDDTERWMRGEGTAAILADIFDAIRVLDVEVMAKGSRRKPRQPKPYPRPWAKGKGEKHIGSDPIPIAQFDSWWDSKEVETDG